VREIKFRGKAMEDFETSHETIQKGEWVYGYYAWYNGSPNIITRLCAEGGGVCSGLVDCIIRVDINTVGQLIGSLDKNEKEIYDRDILKYDRFLCWSREKGEQRKEYIGVVKYASAGFWCPPIKKGTGMLSLDFEKSVVIGNVDDNENLLEGESNG